ncbi:MAG: hypothetical protein COY80_01410 [Candidatus Pacebacteria bacterium CG_4_10_14_0_8_um_filter_42_14]|nr:MAG: hypothetical protein COY80_01410 [Candidatus Pacebacteria bacterium CG_4_10_14_0_8_um_filter_42_14]
MKLRLLIFLSFFIFAVSSAQAATLKINSIGGVPVTNQTFSYWTHTGSNPSFVGVASPSASINLTIGTTSATATAGLDGAWRYDPTTLVAGEHAIAVSSAAESMNFTLLIATEAATKGGVTATPSAAPKTLPQSGGLSSTLLLLTAGLGSLMAGSLWYAGVYRPLTEEN